LKQLRRTLAEQQGVPPYVVFHDKTLRDMVYHMPENEQDMMRINGIGKIKLKRYGQAFLRLIKEIRDNDTAPVDGAAERPV